MLSLELGFSLTYNFLIGFLSNQRNSGKKIFMKDFTILMILYLNIRIIDETALDH